MPSIHGSIHTNSLLGRQARSLLDKSMGDVWIIAFWIVFHLGVASSFVIGTQQCPNQHHRMRQTLPPKTRLHLMKVTVRIVGRKPSEKWLDQGVGMYQQRLGRVFDLQTEWYKSNDSLVKQIQADALKGHAVVILDPKIGVQYPSEVFADRFYEWMQQGGSRLVFVIGGAEGLPTSVLETDYPKVSLSKLTFTHQFARLLLVEQIYRAYEINKGSDYHK
jgi:23S rRNA (pseudouridine1915-N3)-methyltransferase